MNNTGHMPPELAQMIAHYEPTFPLTDPVSRDLLAQLASAQLRLTRAAQLEVLAFQTEATLDQLPQLAALERYRKSAEASYHRALRLLCERVTGLIELLDSTPEEKENYRTNPTTYVRPEPKIGRNEPCPCHSGRKYKVCCLNKTSTKSIAA